MNQRIELDLDMMTDEEMAGLLSDIESLESITQEQPNVVYDRAYHVFYTYHMLRSMCSHQTDGVEAPKIVCTLFTPYQNMGTVSITGKKCEFENPNLLIKAIQLANNVEFYPKTNGKIQIDFTFYGLKKY